MASKTETLAKLDEMTRKLNEQLEFVQGERSVRADIVRFTTPQTLDLVQTMRAFVESS